MTQYVVTAACLVHVPFDTQQGKQLGTLYTGAVLPASVPKEKIAFWLDARMIKEVESESADKPETSAPSGQQEQGAPSGPKAPPESGPGSGKEAWVDYAVQLGIDRADAEGKNKPDLIKAAKDKAAQADQSE